MLEDRLRSLFSKGSLTARAQRIILVLLVLLVTLIGYQISFGSRATWLDLKRPVLSQLGAHADIHDEQARIGKISILYGSSKPVYERALQSHKRHNRQHGYPMFIQRVDVLDGYWTKPAFIHYMILRELRKPESQRLQWLFWFDADTIVLNYNVPLEIFLPPETSDYLKNINVLIADDWNGLNNGIFGIRVTRWAAELFAGILAFRDFEPDTQLNFADQSAMEILLKKRKSVNHVGKVPQRWFNAYETEDPDPGEPYIHAGDFLVHFAGVPNREAHMNKWADRSEQMSEKWNTPLVQTRYPDDVDRFWNHTKTVYDARMKHWNKALEHLQGSLNKVEGAENDYTSENENKGYQSMRQAQKNANEFLKEVAKFKDEIMKEDLHRIEKVSQELDDAYKVFSDEAAKKKAALEEQKKKKEEEEKRKKEQEEEEKRKKEQEAQKNKDYDNRREVSQ